ncbi:hypothetical protein CERZMDRAFT_95923 [Cercospora zeae-maydis SCOH1-5]|uniref:MYND-type domain-containing protein n=1 Tax=Cercospora zeae-maydis SCOH1-5 TaxID=717836 RepID=A0A6A6FKD5_9PEZI|nr:hypothetical protein CERZMDRAFT_95923 [Cercospora zeae-maydis SCOH1-5]
MFSATPWDFASVTQEDIFENGPPSKEDLIFPGLMVNTWPPDHSRLKDEITAMQTMIIERIAGGARPSVDDMATALACAFFDPYANPRTSISSTKADAQPELFRERAEQLMALCAKEDAKAPKHGDEVCGNCGAETRADGSPLLTCGKCKKRRYCSTDCQKKEWKSHKKVCTASTKADQRATFFAVGV